MAVVDCMDTAFVTLCHASCRVAKAYVLKTPASKCDSCALLTHFDNTHVRLCSSMSHHGVRELLNHCLMFFT